MRRQVAALVADLRPSVGPQPQGAGIHGGVRVPKMVIKTEVLSGRKVFFGLFFDIGFCVHGTAILKIQEPCLSWLVA